MCPSSALLAFDTTKPDSMSRKLPDASCLRGLGWRRRRSMHKGLIATHQDSPDAGEGS